MAKSNIFDFIFRVAVRKHVNRFVNKHPKATGVAVLLCLAGYAIFYLAGVMGLLR